MINLEERLKFFDDRKEKPGELPKIRALIYGEAGSGKTTFCASFPNCFFLDFDRGGLTLRNRHIPVVEIERKETVFQTVWDILSQLKARSGVFASHPVLSKIETLVIDSWSSLNDFILIDAMTHGKTIKDPNSDKADYDDWGKLLQRQISICKLLQDIPINVLVTAASGLDKDALGTFIGRPVLKGKFDEEMSFMFDEMYYLQKNPTNDGETRALYTGKTGFYTAKTRLRLPYKIVNAKNPRDVPMYEDLAKILASQTSTASVSS